MNGPFVPDSYRAFIGSSRVSTGTRRTLQARDTAENPADQPLTLSPSHMAILRAVIGRVLPQPEEARIDLAAMLDTQLHAAEGDGWRFAVLPDDRTAYMRGLSVLDAEALARHGQGFADLAGHLQDGILARAGSGDLQAPPPALLDGTQMRRWFEDLRSDAVRLYMAHPATLARIGYSGIGYGGDGDDKPGFARIGLGEREPWEPLSEAELNAR
jgi:hypothetical protein